MLIIVGAMRLADAARARDDVLTPDSGGVDADILAGELTRTSAPTVDEPRPAPVREVEGASLSYRTDVGTTFNFGHSWYASLAETTYDARTLATEPPALE